MKNRVLVAPLLVALVGTAAPAVAGDDGSSSEESRHLMVGAATRDVTPAEPVFVGGFGLGDGSVLPPQVVSPGGKRGSEGERIFARAVVVDDGSQALALVIAPNIGMFVSYDESFGTVGLIDIGRSIEAATGGALLANNVFAAGNHSHSAPDTIGAWGGVDADYMHLIHDAAVGAVVDAYESRRPARLVAGSVDSRNRNFPGSQGEYDLLDNQVCLETASNSFEGENNQCLPRQESVDGAVRVLQAREIIPETIAAERSARGCEGPGRHEGRSCEEEGDVIFSFLSFAAHPTLGGAGGLHGDWPEFAAEGLEDVYGGIGIAWPGAIGRVQPERNWDNRRLDYTSNLLTLVGEALGTAVEVSGDVGSSKKLIRTEVTNPMLLGLLHAGETVGARLMRSREEPWLVGNVVGTVVSTARIGDVAFLGVPGEAYPQIALEAAAAIEGEQMLVTLGLADDMLGYLISHTEDYPVLAAITPINDNAIFNVSPRIGDHVMCAGLRAARDIGFTTTTTPATARCPVFDVEDLITGEDT